MNKLLRKQRLWDFFQDIERLLSPTKERLISPRPFNKWDAMHTLRYRFATKFIGTSGRVLDVGCGIGYGACFLAQHAQQEFVAIDVSKEAITMGVCHYFHPNLSYVVMSAEYLALRSESFDVVISFEVIEHLQNYRNYLSEIHRVLTHDGIFIASTPNRNWWDREIGVRRPSSPYHIKEFYPDEFHIALEQYFEEVEIFGEGIKPQRVAKSARFGFIPHLFKQMIPMPFQRLLTRRFFGYDVCISESDLELVKDLDRSPYMVAICRARTNVC